MVGSAVAAQRIRDAQEAGWELDEQRDHSATLAKRGWGSWKIHIPLFVTFGIGNLIYGCWRRFVSPHTKTVEWDGELPDLDDPLECRRCGETAKLVAKKCPHCGYRGEQDRTDRKRAAWGLLGVGLLIWPLLLFVPFLWLSAYGVQKEGTAPFEGMSRDEWRELSQ